MESIQSRPQPVHPITGAPIRILRTGANIWKEGKILEWVRNGLPPFSSSSSPHDKIATNYIPKDDETQQIKYYVITEHIPNLKEFLTRNTKQPQKQSQQQQQYIVFIAKSIIESFGGEEFIKSNQIPNVLALDEIHLMYPSVGEQWNGTLAHAVYQIALVLRYTRLLGFDSTEHIENTNITYISPNDIPKIWLLQQYYEAKEPKRAREIRYCLQKNIANPHIDKIIFLNESRCIPKQCQSDKITEEIIGNRLTYADILRYIKTSVPPNVIVLFSNSDIYFDSSLTRVWSLLLENKFLALLRYDEEIDAPPKLFGPRSDSQDAWIVASDDIHSREWSGYEDFNFIFGKMGCDNTMAYQMMRKKFLVVNPALSIQAVHVHKSNIRTYETKDMVESPCYVYIDPTPIQEFHAETDLSKYKYSNILYKGEQEINMPLYKFSNSTLTNLGLVYGYNKLYMGSSEESKQHWSKSKIGSLTPSAKCAKSIAVPIKNDIHKRPEEYILFYLSKVLAIREKIGNGAAFWGPEVLDWLRLFSWSEEKLAVVSCDSVKQIYSDEVYAYITTPTYLSPTDIDLLRKNFIYTIDGASSDQDKKAIIVADKGLDANVDAIEALLCEKGYDVRMYYPGTTDIQYIPSVFRNGTLLIATTNKQFTDVPKTYKYLGNSWMMPPGATIIEIQDDATNTKGQEISAACGHKHNIFQQKDVLPLIAALLEKLKAGEATLD